MSRPALETPMMRQYLAIKAQHPDSLLFYRMGDFYELFLADAEVAAKLLDIALTTRDRNKDDAIPMCGVPVHSAGPHIRRLAELGHRVAVCEQVEDARAAGGRRLVRREVIEVVTPGLVGDPEGVEATRECLIAALVPEREQLGLALLDATTGDFRATRVARGRADSALPRALATELQRAQPREILIPEGAGAELEAALERILPRAARTRVPGGAPAAPAEARIEGLAAAPELPDERAAAVLATYLSKHQPFALAQIVRLRRYALGDAMVLDAATRSHLELFENSEDGGRRGTLFERIDRSATPLGARQIARWMAYPLLDPDAIRARQDAVAWLALRDRLRARLQQALRPVRDLERLLARAARPTATPRDLAQLRASLEALPAVAAALDAPDDQSLPALAPERPRELLRPEPVGEAAGLLRTALVDEPPLLLRGSRGASDTGYIRPGLARRAGRAARGGREGAGVDRRPRSARARAQRHPEPAGAFPSGARLRLRGHEVEPPARPRALRAQADARERGALHDAGAARDGVARAGGDRARGRARARALRGACGGARSSRPRRSARPRWRSRSSTRWRRSRRSRARPTGCGPRSMRARSSEIRAGRHPVVEELLRAGSGTFVPNDTELDRRTASSCSC